MFRISFTRNIGILVLIVLLFGNQLNPQILGGVQEPEPPPLLSQFFPFTPVAGVVDFFLITNWIIHSTMAQVVNLELKEAQSQAIISSMLVVARRYINAGLQRYNELIGPEGSSRKGKLQRDIETWEKKYSRFKFGRESLRDSERRIFDKYAFMKDEFIPQWEARMRPCIDFLMAEYTRVRKSASKPDTMPSLVVLSRIIREKLIGKTNPASPVKLGARVIPADNEEALIEHLSAASPEETLALCKERGPLSALSLLTYVLERKATDLSGDGYAPKTEMRVTIYNETERVAIEVYVKPKDEGLSTDVAGVMIYPKKVRPEDQVKPYGLRPGGAHGYAWVSAAPRDEIWIRAMVLGPRRDEVRFKPIGGQNVQLVPECLPRNFYKLAYGTPFPNPLHTKWSVISETYTWLNLTGPWYVTGKPTFNESPGSLRDKLFGATSVSTDLLVWTLPDWVTVERMSELGVTVAGTTKWKREGPRTTRPPRYEDEKGSGLVTIQVEFW